MITDLWKQIFTFVHYDLQVLLEDAMDRKDLKFALFIARKLKTQRLSVDIIADKLITEKNIKLMEWVLINIGKPSNSFVQKVWKTSTWITILFCNYDLVQKEDLLKNGLYFKANHWFGC